MAYKMKGFSGFKSPLRATDAGLVKAADNMSRGLENPTSIIGEGVIGFLDGFKNSYRPKSKKLSAYDKLGPPPTVEFDIEKAAEETKKLQEEFMKTIKSENPPTELNTIKIKPRYKPQNEKIIVSPPKSDKINLAKTRRNKKNRRRNRERP
mgnify:FL=1